MKKKATRRDFLKTSAVAGGAVAAGWQLAVNAHAGGTNETIRIGLVGCGGRGSGAAVQCLSSDSNVKITAVADAFRDRADAFVNRVRNDRNLANKVDAGIGDRIFTGLDAHRQLHEHVDLVVLATPPGFRPYHIQAAIAAGKHVFTEKPVAVDGPGVRMVLAAYEQARQRNLSAVAGTQRRYQASYLESIRRIHDGEIGEITSARCYWNQGGLWHRARTPDMTDVQWQLRNWLYFTWLSGDHICEQHIHNLDVINWALKNAHPIRATGLGGRQVRTGAEFGHINDHFAIDYEYPNNVHVLSMCRQINGCDGGVSEAVTGTRGHWSSNHVITNIAGERVWGYQRNPQDVDPYQEEHNHLLRSIRQGRPINDLKNVAESSLTAILGRMSTYTGKTVTWEQALNSQVSLMPANLTMDMELPVPPVAIPGTTRLA